MYLHYIMYVVFALGRDFPDSIRDGLSLGGPTMFDAGTRLAGADRPTPSYDLANADRNHVIEIRTAHSVYRFSMRGDVSITADWIDGVTMTSNRRGRRRINDERTNTRLWRMVQLDERLPYGNDGELSAVRSVYVGGVRVLG